MPLGDSSKSKVSLASLSATTAAAAESLWSRSKKSSKKKRSSSLDSQSVPEVPSAINPVTETAHPQVQVQLNQQPLDQQEFRQRFLEGLQFYCENSSLILNSDLPADLIEFVTAHGFSVESLGIILELKKSSSAFSDKKTVVPNSSVLGVPPKSDKLSREQNFSEISRRLLQHWMSADSCAEAFVSLSLGEEIPGLIAECASFQRILFAVPDNFHIPSKDFLNFLLSQVTLAINALSYGVKISCSAEPESNQDQLKIRTQTLASVLDRIVTRYFSDGEHFYTSINEEDCSDDLENNPFLKFIRDLVVLCQADVIARRLVGKIFLQVSSHSAFKLGKAIFSYFVSEEISSASTVLYPATEFLEKSSQWKHILQNLPVKTVTKSKRFWNNWAGFIEKESKCCDKFWNNCVDHWIILNKSPLVNEHSLFSATLALTALARQIKRNRFADGDEETSKFLVKLDPGNVLQNVTYSLEGMNDSKRVCGMALAEIVADLQFTLRTLKKEEDIPKQLSFECTSEFYLEVMEFYKNGIKFYMKNSKQQEDSGPGKTQKIQILDSDDDAEDETVENSAVSDGFKTLDSEDDEMESEVGVDPRIMLLRNRKKKIPMYFSEIVETLLESSKNEDEAEILKYIVVLKIPVLLFTGVKIDAKMCATISRCLADLESDSSLQVPIQVSLYELFCQHPFEVADLLAGIVFDRDRYALGQRLMNLDRLVQITQLSSKQSCFSCFSKLLARHETELTGIYPEFIQKYINARKKLRFCQHCKSSAPPISISQEKQDAETVSEILSEESLTWRQIVDRRVAAKTRYFKSPISKTVVPVPDEYSTRLAPILWSSIANRLTSTTPFYLDNEQRIQSGKMHDIFVANVFHYLGKCILGTSGPNCPHIRNLAAHAGELITHFIQHEDSNVRRSVLSLLAVTLCVGEGKSFILEALSSQGNILKIVDSLLSTEQDGENRKFLGQIQQFLAGCSAAGMIQEVLHLEDN